MAINPRKHLGLGPLKKPLFGHNRSHALNATQKISKPNIQKRKDDNRDKSKIGRGK